MAKPTMRAGTGWRSTAVFLSACACALCAQGGTATFSLGGGSTYNYPGGASQWAGGVLPVAGDDVVFPLSGTAGGNIYWLDNTNAVNLGTVSATGWNWVMQFCNSNSQLVDAPHEFSIYDARDFNGWFRSLRPDVVLLPATAHRCASPSRPRARCSSSANGPTSGAQGGRIRSSHAGPASGPGRSGSG